MRYELAKTKNVRMFQAAVGDLLNRTPGVEKMGLLFGDPGEGKSTVVAHAANVYHGVYLRATAGWTMTHMLGTIVKELGGEPMKRRAPMVDWIVEQLARQDRVIFVDEADYLFNSTEMLDVLRDIYDLSGGTPVILIGMEKIARKIQTNGRFARRITQWIEFKGIDLDDARTVADTVCEVKVADDLMAYLHREGKANIARIVEGLSRIESMGKTSRMDTVSLADWGDGQLFYDQPIFRRRG